MKILFLSNLFPDTSEPYRGLDNATVLHELAQRHEVRVIAARPALPWGGRKELAPRPIDAPLQPRFATVRYIPKVGSLVNHKLFADGVRNPMRALRGTFDFDAILSAWMYPDGCAAAQLAEEFQRPFVLIAQGSDVHAYLNNATRRRLITEAAGKASAVITRSADLAKRLAQAGVDPARLHPVYNGVDFSTFKPGDRGAARKELGLRPDAKIILFVGNLLPVKRPLHLITAVSRLDATHHLVMVGGGGLEDVARLFAQRAGVAERITFAGRKSAPEVARYMQAADVLCLASENEGVPNVVLEAFACGLRVVATDVGGLHEVVSAPHLGRLVNARKLEELTPALAKIVALPADTARILEHAQQFSWPKAGAQYEQLLEEAVSAKRC